MDTKSKLSPRHNISTIFPEELDFLKQNEAYQLRLMFDEPYQVTRAKQIDKEQKCDICNLMAKDHPLHWPYLHVNVLCDGDIVKLE